jgi:hypothetical protein
MERISTSYLEYMTDDFSIWQHSNGIQIDKKHGYALDDGARALILVLTYGPKTLAPIYFDFLRRSVDSSNFINFYSKNRKPLDTTWSEDAVGQAYWALALWNKANPDDKYDLRHIEYSINNFISTRGMAYALMGAIVSESKLSVILFSRLSQLFKRTATESWPWIEDFFTYGNAMIPMSFLNYHKFSKDEKVLTEGLLMLDFLNKETKENGIPIAIGCNGWYYKNSSKALFDQQPIDIAYQVVSNVDAYRITKKQVYLDEAVTYFTWFWGNNISKKLIIDPKNQRCLDGLRSDSVSKNCGAESIICYLWAQETIWPYLQEARKDFSVYQNRTSENSFGDTLTGHVS